MANDGVHVGLDPKPITFHYVLGYVLNFSMTLRQVGVAIPWPEAPQLLFGDPESNETFEAVATLSPAETVTDAKATWSFTALDLATIDDLPDETAAVVVQGMPWWMGQAVRHG